MWIDFLILELSDVDRYNEIMNFNKKGTLLWKQK